MQPREDFATFMTQAAQTQGSTKGHAVTLPAMTRPTPASRSALATTVIYIALAVIATAANILAQMLTVALLPATLDRFNLWLGLMVGTVVGLVVKYILDKRFVFGIKAQSARHDAQMFGKYAGFGLITTVIFWGTEWAFDWWFGTKTMRYIGGVIGLGFGYWLKYHLDKRFVFGDGA